jgi:hypothetical protein
MLSTVVPSPAKTPPAETPVGVFTHPLLRVPDEMPTPAPPVRPVQERPVATLD